MHTQAERDNNHFLHQALEQLSHQQLSHEQLSHEQLDAATHMSRQQMDAAAHVLQASHAREQH